MLNPSSNRRPLKTRSATWAKALARWIGDLGISPNAISTLGIVFAGAGAWAFLQIGESRWFWLGGALGIQLRLLANMLDGMVALEGGKKSATGALYNELPDRIEDAVLLIGAGYACASPELGYGATILAIATAYIRANGGALGFEQDFGGPMAKQHRMFTLTLGAFIACVMDDPRAMFFTLIMIIIGSALTCVVRTFRIAKLLKGAQ